MLKIPVSPGGEPESLRYTVTLNGVPVRSYEARVSAIPYNTVWPGFQRPLNRTESASFFCFEADEPVSVRIIADRDFNEAVVRPLNKRILTESHGRNIGFALKSSGQYTVELDGFHCALHIFL